MCKSGLLLLAWRCQFAGSSCKELLTSCPAALYMSILDIPHRPLLLGLLKKSRPKVHSETQKLRCGVKNKNQQIKQPKQPRLWGHWNDSGMGNTHLPLIGHPQDLSSTESLLEFGRHMQNGMTTWSPNDLYFWRSTPQNKGLFQPKQGSFGFHVCTSSAYLIVTESNIIEKWFLLQKLVNGKDLPDLRPFVVCQTSGWGLMELEPINGTTLEFDLRKSTHFAESFESH